MNRQMLVGLLKDWGTAAAIAVVVMMVWRWMAPAPVGSGPAPGLALPDVHGQSFVLSEDASPVTVVNFWATWCAPCRQEIPEFSAFAKANPEVKVVGVSVDKELDAERLGRAATQLGIDYLVVHDRPGSVSRSWGVSSYPTTFVLDAQDQIVAVHIGALTRNQLASLVQRVQGFQAK
jgi:cytochrome c-type biogenesis protein